MLGIFQPVHYEDVLVVRVRELAPKEVWSNATTRSTSSKRMLDANRVKILKFFSHLARRAGETPWRPSPDPKENRWIQGRRPGRPGALGRYTRLLRAALTATSTPWAPWYMVPADDKKARDYYIARTVVDTLDGLGLKYPKASKEVLKLKRKLK
jgi:polyphosphate kinase 2 (PPK2 family)